MTTQPQKNASVEHVIFGQCECCEKTKPADVIEDGICEECHRTQSEALIEDQKHEAGNDLWTQLDRFAPMLGVDGVVELVRVWAQLQPK